MIVTVTLNPALDLTYQLDGSLSPGRTHRVRAVDERPGGKGINVARVLHQLGVAVVATGLLGGTQGEAIRTRLAELGLSEHFVETGQDARRTVVVVGGGVSTGLWEPGPRLAGRHLDDLSHQMAHLISHARCVVFSGSLPPGLPSDAYRRLVALAVAAGVASILDADGDALTDALPAGPTLVKPNLDELGRAVGHDLSTLESTAAAATQLRLAGAGTVVVSRGALGLLAVTPVGTWLATPPRPIEGNPTGAGDACVAALARGLADGNPIDWPELLRDAVALSGAAVHRPVAGEVELEAYQRYRPQITLERMG